MGRSKTASERKHRVGFAEACTVPGDLLEATIPDPDHSLAERRYGNFGVRLGRALVVSYAGPLEDSDSQCGGSLAGTNNCESVNQDEGDTMRDEYDFSKGQRGTHHAACRQGTNVVRRAPDVAGVFRDSESVNQALRTLARLAKGHAESQAGR